MIDVEPIMLPANSSSMPVIQASPQFSSRSLRQRFQSTIARFVRRLVGMSRGAMPDLPDDLHADVGLDRLRSERVEAFWRDRRHSIGRDLPL